MPGSDGETPMIGPTIQLINVLGHESFFRVTFKSGLWSADFDVEDGKLTVATLRQLAEEAREGFAEAVEMDKVASRGTPMVPPFFKKPRRG